MALCLKNGSLPARPWERWCEREGKGEGSLLFCALLDPLDNAIDSPRGESALLGWHALAFALDVVALVVAHQFVIQIRVGGLPGKDNLKTFAGLLAWFFYHVGIGQFSGFEVQPSRRLEFALVFSPAYFFGAVTSRAIPTNGWPHVTLKRELSLGFDPLHGRKCKNAKQFKGAKHAQYDTNTFHFVFLIHPCGCWAR